MAEPFGLQDTVNVFDQAIYAKTFEILQMPIYQSLKNSTVLSLGAFHTTFTVLVIIGKHVGDTDLRDMIVEANLLVANIRSTLCSKFA